MSNDEVKHYGVKGMRWGVRREVIQTARGRQRGLDRKLDRAKADYYKQNTERGRKAALAVVAKADEASWKNSRTAKTLTTGEQIAAAVILPTTGWMVLPTAYVAYRGLAGRENQTFKPRYTEEVLEKIRK